MSNKLWCLIWQPPTDKKLAEQFLTACIAKGFEATIFTNGKGFSIRFPKSQLDLFDTKTEVVKDLCYNVSLEYRGKRWQALAGPV
jgi:hypothetical protein